jgi:predicted enzyme related to lactoylglutathione lyase
MEEKQALQVGTITWRDLTVKDATAVRDFYASVVGWTFRAEDMGGYSDFSMISPSTGDVVTGVCHARGANSEIPPQWLVYITVADVDASAKTCTDLGGTVLVGPKPMGGGRFAVIRDPAGAVCALFRPGS